MTQTQFVYNYIPDPESGRPIANGKLYFGEPDLDPVIPANQITVQGQQEDGSLVALVQPIRTSAGGVPLYNGSPVVLVVSQAEYSLKVLTANDSQVYYQENVQTPGFGLSAADISFDDASANIGATNLQDVVDTAVLNDAMSVPIVVETTDWLLKRTAGGSYQKFSPLLLIPYWIINADSQVADDVVAPALDKVLFLDSNDGFKVKKQTAKDFVNASLTSATQVNLEEGTGTNPPDGSIFGDVTRTGTQVDAVNGWTIYGYSRKMGGLVENYAYLVFDVPVASGEIDFDFTDYPAFMREFTNDRYSLTATASSQNAGATINTVCEENFNFRGTNVFRLGFDRLPGVGLVYAISFSAVGV